MGSLVLITRTPVQCPVSTLTSFDRCLAGKLVLINRTGGSALTVAVWSGMVLTAFPPPPPLLQLVVVLAAKGLRVKFLPRATIEAGRRSDLVVHLLHPHPPPPSSSSSCLGRSDPALLLQKPDTAGDGARAKDGGGSGLAVAPRTRGQLWAGGGDGGREQTTVRLED